MRSANLHFITRTFWPETGFDIKYRRIFELLQIKPLERCLDVFS